MAQTDGFSAELGDLLRSPGEDMAVYISYLVYSRYYLEYTR